MKTKNKWTLYLLQLMTSQVALQTRPISWNKKGEVLLCRISYAVS